MIKRFRKKSLYGGVGVCVAAGLACIFLCAAENNSSEKASLGFRSDSAPVAEGGSGSVDHVMGENGTKSAPERASAAVSRGDVTTTPVTSVTRPAILRLTGALIPEEKSDVASNASGIVQKVFVDRGSYVAKGSVLVQLDPTDAENQLAQGLATIEELKVRLGLDEKQNENDFQAENQPEVKAATAAQTLAASNYERSQALYKKGIIAKELFDQSQTEYDSAREKRQQALYQARQLYQSYKTALTRLAILRKAVADTAIIAPFTGSIAEKYVSTGEHVTDNPQGDKGKIITMIRIDPIRLSLKVPQQQIGYIHLGQETKFFLDAFPDKTFTGTIRYISPVVSEENRSMIVEATVLNPDTLLRPGMFATAELELPERRTEVFVPPSALLMQGEASKVFVVRQGAAREQVVAVGERLGDRVQILSGLGANDIIVTSPDRVRDGDRIQ